MNYEVDALLVGCASGVVCWLGLSVLIPVLRSHGVVDVPSSRSSHVGVVPRGAGVSVILGTEVGAVVGGASGLASGPVIPFVLAVVTSIALVGLLDDLRDVLPWVRLGAQLLAGIAVSLILELENISTSVGGVVVMLGAALWVISYINAFNFMDGINGLSALSGAAAGVWFAAMGATRGDVGVVVLGASLAGSLMGFVPWNLPNPRVFLGDVGSYGIGALLATLALMSLKAGASILEAIAPLVIGLLDTGVTLVRRGVRRESLMSPHREHVYQRLAASCGHTKVSLMILLLVGLSCFATTLPTFGEQVLAMIAVALVYLISPACRGIPRLPGPTT